MKNQENFHHYSSKVKGIFVELKNYSFYHRPTDADNPDRRFIGRKKVLQKIKAILTNSEVKSGAYLITGFRGMGKTSVVNRVIEDLKGTKTYNPRLSRYIRIITTVFFFSIFNVKQTLINIWDGEFLKIENWVLTYFPLLILAYCISIVIHRSKSINNLFKDEDIKGRIQKNRDWSRLILFEQETRSTSNIYYLIAHDYFIASSIHILALIIIFIDERAFGLIDTHLYSFKFIRYLLSTIGIFSLLSIINYINKELEKNKVTLKRYIRAIFKEYKIKIINYWSNYWSNSPRKVVVLSLLLIAFIVCCCFSYDIISLILFFVILLFLSWNLVIAILWISLLVVFFSFGFIRLFIFTYLLLSLAILLNWSAITNKLYSFINYSHFVSIKINLGQEKLKEKDILKLVAKSIFEEYKRLIQTFSTPRRFWWRFLSGVLFYLFVLTIYHYRPTYSMMSEIRNDIKLSEYFPSQKIFSSRYMPIDYKLDRLVVEEMELTEKINSQFGYQDYFDIIYDFRGVDLINQLSRKEFADQENLEAYTESITNHLRTHDRYSIITKLLLEENLLFSNYEIINVSNTIYVASLDAIQQKKLLRSASRVRIKNEIKRILAHNKYYGNNDAYLDVTINSNASDNIFIYIKDISKDSSLVSDLVEHLKYQKDDTDWYMEILKHSVPSDFRKIISPIIKKSKDLGGVNSLGKVTVNKKRINRDTLSKLLTTETTKNAKDSILQILIKDELLIERETDYGWLRAITIRVDYFIYTLYSDFSHFLFESNRHISKKNMDEKEGMDEKGIEQNFFNSTLDLEPNFHFLPPRLDYLFFIFLLVFWVLLQIISRSSIFGVNHYQVLKELRNLIDSIDASIALGTDNSIGTKKTYPFYRGFTRNRIYPLASEREIETKLIQILSLSEQIPLIRMRPKFIFIFDELDKIEPTGTYSENSEEDLDSYVTEGTRKRQQTIGRILSNLKHFFNTAKAKFIFIAGREMYDAAIADISDRDSLIGSLFHEVIYINSFFKDPSDDKLSDITSMTERYVCQFLLPPNHSEISLKGYRVYLEENILIKAHYSDEKNYHRMIGKIIFTLQNFITYLTYRSNGSPKKITKIFEEHIYSFDKNIEKEATLEGLYVGKDYRNLYLRFTFYDQYIFGFSSFLFNPFVYNINRHLQDYGDKLLVSTAFLLNHIYKFHGAGFSFRTLELIPEIIAVNKAPELRNFIDNLLNFLSRIHIREILSGLHQFKFNSRIEREIKFISKISEKESAAHNFTLDESIELKRLYKRKLDDIRKVYQTGTTTINEVDNFITPPAYLNLILGDLHFHDQEYENAVLHYQQAVLPFRNNKISEYKIDDLIFYIRAELKLGMTYEKKRNYDDALIIYESLKNKVIAFAYLFNDKFKWMKKNDKEYDYLLTQENLGSQLLLTLRLIYQPFLAELQLIEKHTIKSFTKVFIKSIEDQFRNIINQLHPEQSYILAAEHYDKMGDVLFYKSGILFGKKEENENDYQSFVKRKEKVRTKRKTSKIQFASYPISAFEYYLQSLSVSVKNSIREEFEFKRDPIKIEKGFEVALELLHESTLFLFKSKTKENKEFPVTRKTVYTTLGNSLSDVGDCILCFASQEKDVFFKFKNLNKILYLSLSEPTKKQYYKYHKNNQKSPNLSSYSSLEIGIRFIYLAASYYLNAGEYKEYAFQLSKILHLIRMHHDKITNESEKDNILKLLQKQILGKGIRHIFRAYENNNDAEITKLRNIFDITTLNFSNLASGEKNKIIDSLIKTNTSASEDIKELLIVYKELELEWKGIGDLTIKDCIVNSYSTVSRRHNRILEIKYRVIFNFQLLHKRLEIINIGQRPKEKIEACFELNPNIFAVYQKRLAVFNSKTVEKLSFLLKSYNYYNSYGQPNFDFILKDFLEELKRRQIIGLINDKEKIDVEKKFNELIPIVFLNKIRFLINDSIFCFFELIRSIEIYEISYIHSHTLIASIYRKLGFWLELFHAYEEKELATIEKGRIRKDLERLIGKVEADDINPESMYERALSHYYKAIEMHTEGGAYQNIIQNMYYLDDTFNDNLYHFCATMDRMKINSGKISIRINDLKEKVKERREYEVDNYF